MIKPKEKQKSQKQRFIETAKELGCDESEKAFEDSFGRIVLLKAGQMAPMKTRKRMT